jgi:betaine reductase
MYPVIKGAAYALFHTPHVLLDHGTTQTVERKLNPHSNYLLKLPNHLRSFKECAAYAPNQAYIGNIHPKLLKQFAKPWYSNPVSEADRFGKFGEIMPEDEFYGIMKLVDAFELVMFETEFAKNIKEKLHAHPVFKSVDLEKLKKTSDKDHIAELVSKQAAEPIKLGDRLVGCVRRAHETDDTLSARVIFENISAVASAVVTMLNLFHKTGLDPKDVDYIIECSEEACGDMNQRGGGNFAKAIGELTGCVNATGSDTRGFCAAPAHAMITAAALVKAGIYKNVVVAAGGATSKLGMNGKDHINKNMPVLEDVLGGFAIWVSEDDHVNPVIRTDIVGRHTIGSGASPQATMQAIVTDPLDKNGLKITDIDRYGVEMQNSEITIPAGAGDVTLANYKMIAALGVRRGEIERADIDGFTEKHGLPGFAPTQGHIPSGVPVIGHARDMILNGDINRAMIIGKGSLFLARMTNLFDGVSFVIEKNPGKAQKPAFEPDAGKKFGTFLTERPIRIGITLLGSEHGIDEIVRGAEIAASSNPGIEVVLIGPEVLSDLNRVDAKNEKEQHELMEKLLEEGQIDAAVTMHYNFPVGVATVGRIITPGRGREVFLATTTGTAAFDRAEAMVKNAICGIAAAKASGIKKPSLGILNLDAARKVESHLKKLAQNGYELNFAESLREDGGLLLRGNDLLAGTSDVIVADTLTGNVLMKIFSAYTTGGDYESLGCGYGPGIGEGFNKIILILSRASGSPVVAGAVKYAIDMVRGKLREFANAEFAQAKKAGLSGTQGQVHCPKVEDVAVPTAKPVTEEISGIDILDLEAAVREVWKEGIFAAMGMGCTGPVILTAAEDFEKAKQVLIKKGF